MKRHKVLVTTLLYAATLGVVMCCWRQPVIAAGLLAIIAWLLAWVTDYRFVPIYFITAIGGSLSELLAIWAGAWSYGLPTPLGIPIWLPLVWGNASMFFIELYDRYGKKSA